MPRSLISGSKRELWWMMVNNAGYVSGTLGKSKANVKHRNGSCVTMQPFLCTAMGLPRNSIVLCFPNNLRAREAPTQTGIAEYPNTLHAHMMGH